ncbi:MAG: DNA repair protein RadC [Spirochaetaceae bacterium]|nr:DNA repair protein RadC [Spirochaetaceae bacterium]
MVHEKTAVRDAPPQIERSKTGEKLVYDGPRALSDHELLTVVLKAGSRRKNAPEAAEELLERLDKEKTVPQVQDISLMTGFKTACSVVAMLEFGRRRWGAAGAAIKHPDDIFSLIRHYADRKQERFVCLSLNGAHEVLAARLVTVGLVNRTIVHPREVFADPLMDRASAVVVAHNHPSGQLAPSKEDDEITIRLKAASEILGLRFLDHVIFSEAGYFSYRQTGKLH